MKIKLNKNQIIQLLEVLFWLLVIIITIFAVVRLQWSTASNVLQIIALAALLVSVYFYLNNRTLYNESKLKTDQLIRKQRELRERQKTIDLIFKNSADGILILDQDKKIIEFSPGMEKIAGYGRDEALGKDAQRLLQFSAEKGLSLLPDLMFSLPGLNKQIKYVENSLISKIGKIVGIEASHTLIHDSKTNKTLALAIIRDITYEKNLVERDKEFITITSHQLNTPLSIIRGYASLLDHGKAGNLNDKQSTFVKEILKACAKMITLTNSLLSISRIEQDKIKLEISDVNIKELLAEELNSLQERASEKGIKLLLKLPDKNIIIMGDQDKLHQAISNLIDNAIKYTPKGRVTLSLVDRPEVVDIIVADTGIGIPSPELEKIGTRFYRSQNAIDIDNHGSGLGIYIAQTIIEKHHGHLRIESKEDEYTKAIVTLPKRQTYE